MLPLCQGDTGNSELLGFPRVREKSGENNIFSMSGSVSGNFEKMSRNFGHLTNAGELSGNFDN